MDVKWLNDLEKKIEQAVAELKKLRKENKAQSAKIEKLQQQLSEAKNAGKTAADWGEEREEIKRRVEELSAGLEKLL